MMEEETAGFEVQRLSFSFGGYITGDVYYPSNLKEGEASLTPIIFIHPYAYADGYVPQYVPSEEFADPFYYHFATRGYGHSSFSYSERAKRGNESTALCTRGYPQKVAQFLWCRA